MPMNQPRTRSLVRLLPGILGATACIAIATPGRGDEPPPRRGGLLPRRVDAVTREELVRRWDLDSDGTIDASEAEVARTRMRRERAELWRTTGIDPLTGQPRGEAEAAESGEPPAPDLAAEPEPEPKPQRAEAAPPGSRVPEVRLPDSVRPTPQLSPPPTTRVPEARKTPTAPPPRSGQNSVTGGIRAGAPAARPGYGTVGVGNDLNAGRRPGVQPRSGGVPARSGAAVPRRPAAPAPAPVPTPRISAEEIGGY